VWHPQARTDLALRLWHLRHHTASMPIARAFDFFPGKKSRAGRRDFPGRVPRDVARLVDGRRGEVVGATRARCPRWARLEPRWCVDEMYKERGAYLGEEDLTT
jgi:hypothetical protein